jgi:hypothetical protein
VRKRRILSCRAAKRAIRLKLIPLPFIPKLIA